MAPVNALYLPTDYVQLTISDGGLAIRSHVRAAGDPCSGADDRQLTIISPAGWRVNVGPKPPIGVGAGHDFRRSVVRMISDGTEYRRDSTVCIGA
jgi:hypothetical protein